MRYARIVNIHEDAQPHLTQDEGEVLANEILREWPSTQKANLRTGAVDAPDGKELFWAFVRAKQLGMVIITASYPRVQELVNSAHRLSEAMRPNLDRTLH